MYTTTHFLDFDVHYIPASFEIESYVPYLKNVYKVKEETSQQSFELLFNYDLDDIKAIVKEFNVSDTRDLQRYDYYRIEAYAH